jgi:hypothetical protein
VKSIIPISVTAFRKHCPT